IPRLEARLMTLLVTKAVDRTRTKPAPAWRIVLLESESELAVAVTARSTRSKVDHEIEPEELALNWMPPHVIGEPVLFAVKMIALEAVPSATSEPSMKRWTPGSNLTVVPGRMVSVAGARTVTWYVATYIVSLMPHVVSVVMSPRTYVVAVAVGAVIRNAAVAEASSTQTITKVRPRVVVGWARMCDTDSAARVCPALVSPRFHTTLYYPKDAVIAGDIEFASGRRPEQRMTRQPSS